MTTKTFSFDAAELLDTPEAQAAYLSEIMGEGDAQVVAEAIGTVARARGMTAVARQAGVGRESLYRALSGQGNPEFGTVMKVLDALGLALTVSPKSAVEVEVANAEPPRSAEPSVA